ncbi:calcium-binding protein [Herbaspirillum sp. alder98]|uniref:calcium-binding protein n=1 Tax=Herbaspirillum sp. alder98 TaxID=2913096 RepID=UPI002A59B15E|nr:calcium-binding protein [Herbaspirillum sp. alder98]
MPSVTIYIADRGTTRTNGEPAMVGHMWYSIADDKLESRHFSFYQDTNYVPEDANPLKKLFSKGNFYFDDGEKYKDPGYSRTIELTQEQYDSIKKFSENPEAAGFSKHYNAFTNSCIDFVWAALRAADINPTNFEGDLWPQHNKDNVESIGRGPIQGLPMWQEDPMSGLPWPIMGIETDGATSNKRGMPGISNSGAESARAAIQNETIDPLALDLDGDGIETEGSEIAPLFDHTGDGIRTGTGWLKPDDGWLVLDRDGNGTIDSGSELFGVNTVKKNGLLARDGFDALSDFDTNSDKQIDVDDEIFTRLRVWRDLNQDGVSPANELASLAALEIKTIQLQAINANKWLGNGNMQRANASFSRLDGSVGTVSNLDLATDSFQRIFTTSIARSNDAAFLPDLRGSGRVRDLSEAISLSPTLTKIMQKYVALSGRQEQINLLDEFIESWAETSDMKSLRMQASEHAAHGTILEYHLDGIQNDTKETSNFLLKLGIVERFMGFTYRSGRGQVNTENMKGDERNLIVRFSARQIENITTAYERFKGDIYESLVPMTRLRRYYFALLSGSINSDFSELENAFSQAIKIDKLLGIADVLEFIGGISRTRFTNSGWDYQRFLIDQLRNSTSQTEQRMTLGNFSAQFAGTHERALTGSQSHDVLVSNQGNSSLDGGSGNDTLISLSGNDHLMGGAGNDVLDAGSGNDQLFAGSGNDRLYGGEGNDSLFGESGDDLIAGGTGNDKLKGGSGDDVYLFDRGDGRDTITDSYYQRPRTDNDTILFGSNIAPEDISIVRNYSDDLILKVNGADDSVTVQRYFTADCNTATALENISFADGTTWDIDTIKKMAMIATDANDSICGYSTDDVIHGDAGDDWLRGAGGNDTLDGGDGNDNLVGGSGNDQLHGGEGNDSLSGESGNDILNGGAGNDVLIGGAGDDILNGGEGNDDLTGSAGDDVYLFDRGDGQDIIRDPYYQRPRTDNDTILFGSNIASEDISIVRNYSDDLILKVNGTDDSFTVQRYFTADCNTATALENISFADGTTWDIDTIKKMAMIATDANDSICGYSTDDVIHGDAGDDWLRGAGGNDTLDGGDGNDNLVGGSGNDQLHGGEGNDSLSGESGNDILNGGAGNDVLIGGAGDDILNGGEGNDDLTGSAGDDVYLFDKGDGQDIIRDPYYQRPRTDNDTILFGSNIAPEDISIVRNYSDDLILKVNGTDDSFTVQRYFTADCNTATALENISFADGTTWDIDTIKKMAMIATDANDSIWGYSTDDIIHGNAGDDWLRGAGGNDTLDGGDGNDNLVGGGGNDRLNGGDGNDSLYGDSGDDLLDGGTGDDFLNGGTGNDTYIFSRDSNSDVISHNRHGIDEFDTVLFGDDISEQHIWLQRSGYDLELQLLETHDKLTVRNWYLGSTYQIGAFQLQNGKQLLANQVDSMVGAFATLLQPGSRLADLSADQKFTMAAAAGANWR